MPAAKLQSDFNRFCSLISLINKETVLGNWQEKTAYVLFFLIPEVNNNP